MSHTYVICIYGIYVDTYHTCYISHIVGIYAFIYDTCELYTIYLNVNSVTIVYYISYHWLILDSGKNTVEEA